jgi:anti-sigma B factor antagonist
MFERSSASEEFSVLPAGEFECTLLDGAPDAATVKVVGDLDIATAPVLQRALQEACSRAGAVVLDLRDLTFIDSAGLRVVINASREAERAGLAMSRLRGPAHVERVFDITGTAAIVAIAAEASIGPAAPAGRAPGTPAVRVGSGADLDDPATAASAA